jgi:hypothetical protein
MLATEPLRDWFGSVRAPRIDFRAGPVGPTLIVRPGKGCGEPRMRRFKVKKFSIRMKVALIAGLVIALFITSAFSFSNGAGVFGRGSGNANTRNGVVYAYSAGKFISIRGFGRTLYEYNITANTKIFPESLASGIGPGAQVAVVGQCYYTKMTSGCTAIQIWVRLPMTGAGQKK